MEQESKKKDEKTIQEITIKLTQFGNELIDEKLEVEAAAEAMKEKMNQLGFNGLLDKEKLIIATHLKEFGEVIRLALPKNLQEHGKMLSIFGPLVKTKLDAKKVKEELEKVLKDIEGDKNQTLPEARNVMQKALTLSGFYSLDIEDKRKIRKELIGENIIRMRVFPEDALETKTNNTKIKKSTKEIQNERKEHIAKITEELKNKAEEVKNTKLESAISSIESVMLSTGFYLLRTDEMLDIAVELKSFGEMIRSARPEDFHEQERMLVHFGAVIGVKQRKSTVNKKPQIKEINETKIEEKASEKVVEVKKTIDKYIEASKKLIDKEQIRYIGYAIKNSGFKDLNEEEKIKILTQEKYKGNYMLHAVLPEELQKNVEIENHLLGEKIF
jgi:hypothetical protein